MLLDLRTASVGDRVVLSSLPFDAMTFGERADYDAHNGEAVPANGAPLDIMLIRVTGQTRYERQVPQQLSSVPPVDEPQEQRTFVLDQSKGHWRINRATYRMTDFAFSVQRGAREVWEFRNPGPGMPHPIHVHGFQYRVTSAEQPAAREAACVGCARRARDRVSVERQRLLWPNETIRLAMDFSHPHHDDRIYSESHGN